MQGEGVWPQDTLPAASPVVYSYSGQVMTPVVQGPLGSIQRVWKGSQLIWSAPVSPVEPRSTPGPSSGLTP